MLVAIEVNALFSWARVFCSCCMRFSGVRWASIICAMKDFQSNPEASPDTPKSAISFVNARRHTPPCPYAHRRASKKLEGFFDSFHPDGMKSCLLALVFAASAFAADEEGFV